MNINLYINKQSARAEAPEIFSGSVGVLTVTLFGELDSSLVTALRFMHESGDGYYTAALENGSAVVPHEVIKAPGFSIAVAGYENDGDTVVRFLPSEAVYIPVKENGYGSPDDAVSEEGEAKSLIGQILSECTETREEALLAQEKLSQSYKSEQEKLSQSYNTAAIVLEEKCNENKAYIDEKSEELTNNLSSEKTQREAADDALLLRISEEEEAREAADSELEERIINTERGIAAVRDELEADIKDNLSGYVKKEDGKGLSTYANVLTGVYDDPNVNAEVTEIELVSASGDSGDNKYITFFTPEQTDAYIDKKLADLPTGGGDVGLFLGAVDLLQIFEPGLYTIFTRNSSYLPTEVEGLIESDSDKVSTYAMLKVSPYHLVEDDAYDYPVKYGEMQELTVQFYDDNWNVYSCVYTHSVYTDPTTSGVGEYAVMDDGWVKIADSRGMGDNSGNMGADLSGYVKNTDYATADKAGVVKVNEQLGISINADNQLLIACAPKAGIDKKASYCTPVVPAFLDYAVSKSTHQTISDDYDVTSLGVAANFSGNQGQLPVSYDAVKAYIEETLLGGAW